MGQVTKTTNDLQTMYIEGDVTIKGKLTFIDDADVSYRSTTRRMLQDWDSIILDPPDERLKENITTFNNAMSKVKQLRGVTFKWKKNGKESIGVVAQEIEKVIPEAVIMSDSDTDRSNWGMKNVDYSSMIGILIEGLKEQQNKIDEQEKVITQQSKDITQLKEIVASIQAKL